MPVQLETRSTAKPLPVNPDTDEATLQCQDSAIGACPEIKPWRTQTRRLITNDDTSMMQMPFTELAKSNECLAVTTTPKGLLSDIGIVTSQN